MAVERDTSHSKPLEETEQKPERVVFLVEDNHVSMKVTAQLSLHMFCAFEQKRKIRNTTIVALTGVTSSEARNRAIDAGVDEYLTKPARMKDVTALITNLQNKGEVTLP